MKKNKQRSQMALNSYELEKDTDNLNFNEVPEVSIIIPAFNESSGIGYTLEQIKNIARELNCEIIVVDDGSTDNTCSIAESYGIRVIKHSHNKGYGAALKTGIRNSLYEIICITDADGTYPNDSIPLLIQEIIKGRNDMVVGVRTGEQVTMPKARRLVKWILRKLANFVSGERIPDLNSGLRAFKKEAVLNFIKILPDGFSFTTTITLGMLVNGYSVKYIPINYNLRKGRSKIKPIRDTLNFIQLILRIGLYFAPLKIFLPLSGLLFILAIIWGMFSYFVLNKFADASTLTIIMAGIQIGAIGLLAELMNHRIDNNYKEK